LRIRETLRVRLAREAVKNQRPLTAEIAHRLERSLDADAMQTVEEMVDKLARRFRKQLEAA
jgi:hypothetical protein